MVHRFNAISFAEMTKIKVCRVFPFLRRRKKTLVSVLNKNVGVDRVFLGVTDGVTAVYGDVTI